MALPPASEWLRARGGALLAFGCVSACAGLFSQNPALMALGIALVAVPLFVQMLLGRALEGVVVTRTVADAVCEGDLVRVVITIQGSGRLPLFFIRLTDVFGPQTLSSRSIEGPARLDGARPVDLEYLAPCVRTRGIHQVGPIVLHASDPFSWFTRSRQVVPASEIKVYPRLRDAALPDRIVASFTDPQSTPPTVVAGDSDEFFGVRDFRPGDLLKRIHWPTTARRGFPVVREFLPPVQREMVVFLDISRALRFAGAKLRNFEQSVRFVASLSARAARAGFRFSLRCGEDGAFDVAPSTGRSQYLRVVERLIRVRTREENAFAGTIARGLVGAAHPAVAVVVLHPYLVGDPALAAKLERLRRQGFRVACVVYGHREEAYGPVSTARYRAGLSRLAASGVELWKERS